MAPRRIHLPTSTPTLLDLVFSSIFTPSVPSLRNIDPWIWCAWCFTRAWKAKHDVELEERAAKEQKARADSRAQGRAELDKLLADHSAKVQKTKALNRENEASAPNAQSKEGDEWEQVASYMGSKIEREGARDTSRFREIVFKQKH